ncbi:putative GPI anchored protein [Aspergillus chevalieri]|uniref:GPI anchored protein n=1 Tax=Aspergillus chevalieri TaxID=182096 RepID=A0A7R7VK80_ASPCH|nr:uncharacterized protein ACHE_30220S [Aspergillus chevalieri]BCR86233.1 hypothetical protein ACHE_30220S [Aspergillus chevalieri]
MHFKTTLLVTLSALAVAQQSSQAVGNPATGYLEQTNSGGAITGQPEAATSQQAAATSQPSVVTSQEAAASTPAGASSGLIPSQTSGQSTLVTSTGASSSAGASSTATLTSTATKSTSSSGDDDSSSSSSSSSSGSASSSTADGAAAVPTAGSVGLTVGLAGAALAALL